VIDPAAINDFEITRGYGAEAEPDGDGEATGLQWKNEEQLRGCGSWLLEPWLSSAVITWTKTGLPATARGLAVVTTRGRMC